MYWSFYLLHLQPPLEWAGHPYSAPFQGPASARLVGMGCHQCQPRMVGASDEGPAGSAHLARSCSSPWSEDGSQYGKTADQGAKKGQYKIFRDNLEGMLFNEIISGEDKYFVCRTETPSSKIRAQDECQTLIGQECFSFKTNQSVYRNENYNVAWAVRNVL